VFEDGFDDGLDFYNAELRAHHGHLRAAYGVGSGEEVLDIGCRAGLTSREAARAAAPGRVLGIDVSGIVVSQCQGPRRSRALHLMSGAAQRFSTWNTHSAPR
jgi:cyclopropane fatty-acyl-phospholipid synthase-like methyltransferase